MPRIPPLPLATIKPPLANAISDARQSGVLSSTLPVRIWAHRPETASSWLATINSFYSNSVLDDRLRELVRLKIASLTKCETCQLARKSAAVSDEDIACLAANNDRFTPAEQSALTFAELFAADYQSIGCTEFDALKIHFSIEAIVELNMFCALMLAGGRMTYVLSAYEDDP